MSYQVASGYNNAGSLTVLSIQPRMIGIAAGRRIQAGDGSVIQDGLGNATLIFDAMAQDSYDDILSEFFLTTAISAEITINLPVNNTRTFAAHNAIVVKPDLTNNGEFSNGLYKNIQFRLTGIELI